MKIRRFEEYSEFKLCVINMLREHFCRDDGGPHAVVLPGGVTPLDLYEAIRSEPFEVSNNLHIIVSDERYVSDSSDFYNYANICGMITALAIPEKQVINVNTSLGFSEAAAEFDTRLSSFLEDGGTITLALLGLGVDGHTASLFTRQDLYDAEGQYGLAVRAHEGPDRISLTPDFLSQAERAVIITAGEGKSDMVADLEERPGDVIAGRVLNDVKDAEVWHSVRK